MTGTVEGAFREEAPCKACGKPRVTLLVGSGEHETESGRTLTVTKPMMITVCLACDGGFEWRQAS